jgi:hypothetical protein
MQSPTEYKHARATSKQRISYLETRRNVSVESFPCSYVSTDPYRRLICAVYLKAAVDSLFLGSAPLSQTIPIMKRLKEEYPNISPLWDNSGLALSGRNESVEYILEFLESALVKVEKGEYGLDDGVTPKGLNLVPWFIKGKQAR